MTPSRAAAAVVLAVLLPLAAQAQSPAWKSLVDAVGAYARSDSVVGWSVAEVRGGRIVTHHEAGLADRSLGQKTDKNTLYHWASTTKTMTAIAIMQLRDRSLLSLDDKVTRWIPELRRVHNPFGSMDDITIRMLLSHSAGFQNPTWPYDRGLPWEPLEPMDWEQLVAMMPYEEVLFPPGSRYSYSNPAFIYLGRIIELLTGDPYQVYIQKNIWTPLGMTRSYFNHTPRHLERDRANSYTRMRDTTAGRARDTLITNGREFHTGITTANGGWNGPIADAARWVAYLLGAAPGDTARARLYDVILRRASLEEMWRPLASTATPGESMGLSFFLSTVDGERYVGHTGDQQGFHLYTLLAPRTGAGVILAFNTSRAGGRESPLYAPMLVAAAALLRPPR
jgi:CubicO group peptidase (beta-lactamase class C family)